MLEVSNACANNLGNDKFYLLAQSKQSILY